MSDGGGPVRPSRVRRAEQARRTRRAIAVVGIVVLVIAAAVWLVGRGDGDEGTSAAPDDSPGRSNPEMLALQVDGGPAPMLAVVGVPPDATPFTMPLSSELTVVMPGQGETSAAGVAALPGPSMQVALSNMSGIWIDHYAVLPLRDLGAAIDEAGGVEVSLASTYPTTLGDVGPGEVTFSGAQARAFLAGATDDAGVRWEILLTALLADPPSVAGLAQVESDDAEAASRVLADARGAEVLAMPTERVTATIVVPVYPALDQQLSRTMGTPMPVPTIVQNGSGRPGVGEEVARRIIPAGYRIVLSQNAQTFDVERTDVFANGTEHEGEARTVADALGVNRVRVAAVPSNVGDITIVVGKDFTA